MIAIYDKNAVDFGNNGLGTLDPVSCIVSETINGNFEVVLTHPIDEAGKFARIQEERIIKVPVPAGRTPRISMSAAAGTIRIYKVTTDGRRLYLRAAPSSDAKGIKTYKPGTEVIVIDNTTNSKWSEVETPDGKHGWMWTGNLSYVRTETVSAAVDSIKEPALLRDQPFRIYKVEPTLTGVTAYARHIFYDLMDNMVLSYTPAKTATGAAAFKGLEGAAEDEHGFTFYSDLDSTAEEVEITDKNPAEAILGDGGLIEAYGGELMRDWWDVYLAKRIGEETGIQIREGKNLLGIKYSIDITNCATRIIPKGEDADGKPLYLPEKWIENTAEDRAQYVNHKYTVLEVKEAKEKTKGDDKRTKEECYELMREAAEAAFQEGADLPDVTLQVDFIDCAETEEYRQYRNLQGIHMGDTAKVVARRVGVAVAMRMTQYSYDCLKKRYSKMTLGTVDATIEGNMINPRSIGTGTIKGSMIKLNAVGSGQIQDGAVNGLKIALAAIDYAHIGQAAINQLSANAITAIRADIRELVAGNITTDQLYADLAVIAAAQITAANIEKANIQWAEIENLAVEIAKVVNAEIGKAVIDSAQIKDLSAVIAVIAKAEIEEASIDWAQIKNAEIDTAQIKLGAITQALIAAGAIGTAQIADGSITEAKIVSLNADVIKTGTLSVERLLLKGKDGLFYAINATAGGLTSAQLTEEQYKNAISGTALVARSVTADKIAAKSITANEILGQTITAAEINVANLFAAEATITALNSYITRTQTIEAIKGKLDVWAEDKINIAVGGIRPGGTNLLRDSKGLEIGTTADDWRVTGSNLVTRYGNASGFYRFKLTNSGQTENGGWVSASSPLARLPDGWYGKEVTLTAWIWSENWAAVDAGITWSVCLSQGGTARINWGDKYSIVVPGKAELGADAKSDTALANSKWVRVSTTFRLDEDGAGSGDGDLRANTHIFARFYLRRNGEYRIYAPMMEFGNLAGDWSPAPEDAEAAMQAAIAVTQEAIMLEVEGKADKGELDTGDGGGVHAIITKDKFSVDVPGEDGDFELNKTGAKVPVLIANDVSAPNVTPRYAGASTLYVDPNATSAQIATGNYFRSLADALAKINGKWLPFTVTISMKAGMDEYGTLQVRGIAGNGQVLINGNGAKLTGQMFVNLMGVPTVFDALHVDVPSGGYGYDIGNGSVYAQVKNCVLNGSGSGWGVRSAHGSQVTVNACELYGLTRSLYTQYGGRLYGEGNKGDCVAASASGGFMSLTGTQPCHQTTWTAYKANAGQVFTEGVTVDMGTATPPVAEPTTAEFSMLHADTYAGGYESSWNYQSHDDIMQGYTEHAGRIFGCIWFDNSAIRAAGIKTVKQAALRLTAQKYVGRGVSVEVHLWGTATEYTGRSGAPALTVDYGVIGTAAPGETTTITIPAQAAADLASGAINALMLYSDDTGLYKDRNYSKNYMRFDGGTKGDAGTRPVLTVVYQ